MRTVGISIDRKRIWSGTKWDEEESIMRVLGRSGKVLLENRGLPIKYGWAIKPAPDGSKVALIDSEGSLCALEFDEKP